MLYIHLVRRFILAIIVLNLLCANAQGMTKKFNRAVSLSILQSSLKACRNGRCDEYLLYLGGLTSVEGVTIDKANSDIVIFGSHDSAGIPISTEDFVIALRNAYRDSGVPACTIDPDPEVFAQLGSIYKSDGYKGWSALCSSAQDVRVFNIPLDSTFSETIVDADYLLKDIVSGQVPSSHLSSLIDLHIAAEKKAIRQGKASAKPSGMDRFELVAGPQSFVDEGELMYIDYLNVKLVTERQFRAQAGKKFKGTGLADKMAEGFAKEFTAKYHKISREYDIYHKLGNMFDLVALAQMIVILNAEARSGLSLKYFKNSMPTVGANVESQLPGRSFIKSGTVVLSPREKVYYEFPSCGGVSVDVNVRHFKRDGSGYVGREIRRNIDNGRRSFRHKKSYWKFAKDVSITVGMLTNDMYGAKC